MIKLGLTGSIGMGKSTTAGIFKSQGCDVWDADQAVHRLYNQNGLAVDPIHMAFKNVVINGAVCREKLRAHLKENPKDFSKLEKIVHPLVAQDRQEFIDNAKSDIGVFDIPLLFETGINSQMDKVACVFIDEDEQKKRVLARGTMNENDFNMILKRQWPIHEKCAASDFVIETKTLEYAEKQVIEILNTLRQGTNHA